MELLGGGVVLAFGLDGSNGPVPPPDVLGRGATKVPVMLGPADEELGSCCDPAPLFR